MILKPRTTGLRAKCSTATQRKLERPFQSFLRFAARLQIEDCDSDLVVVQGLGKVRGGSAEDHRDGAELQSGDVSGRETNRFVRADRSALNETDFTPEKEKIYISIKHS